MTRITLAMFAISTPPWLELGKRARLHFPPANV
jgi:hypothetical protein